MLRPSLSEVFRTMPAPKTAGFRRKQFAFGGQGYLVQFTSDRDRMGPLAIPRWVAAVAWFVAGGIIVLNLKLLFDFVSGWLG